MQHLQGISRIIDSSRSAVNHRHGVLQEPRITVPNTSTLCKELALLDKTTCNDLSILCGFPSFCSKQAYEICLTTPLKDCEECSNVKAVVFFVIFAVLGLLIILGNGLVIRNVLGKKKGFNDTYSKIRGSLAVADLITGELRWLNVNYSDQVTWTVEYTVWISLSRTIEIQYYHY